MKKNSFQRGKSKAADLEHTQNYKLYQKTRLQPKSFRLQPKSFRLPKLSTLPWLPSKMANAHIPCFSQIEPWKMGWTSQIWNGD
jgi:hypothetical protein